jgi:hypothetical protein
MWKVYSNPATQELVLIPSEDPAPEGWVLEVETANPDYLAQQVAYTTPYALLERSGLLYASEPTAVVRCTTLS